MPNPYASTAGASTITATVSGNDNLNDFRDSRGGGNSDRAQKPMGTAQVARRIFATYVRISCCSWHRSCALRFPSCCSFSCPY